MAHLTARSAYKKLTERINLYPQGAPPAETLYRILQLLFSEVEAALVAQLPIKPFTAKKAARIWKKSENESQKVLDTLAGRGILVDYLPEKGPVIYSLPPPMAGFFEFSMMRLRSDIDQKLLAELFYQYLNVEEDFIKQLFCQGETQSGRVFVHETALSSENSLHVLDYERAAVIVKTARHIGVGICFCRHKMEHVGRACAAEQDICLTSITLPPPLPATTSPAVSTWPKGLTCCSKPGPSTWCNSAKMYANRSTLSATAAAAAARP
jgi:hypothetical protein